MQQNRFFLPAVRVGRPENRQIHLNEILTKSLCRYDRITTNAKMTENGNKNENKKDLKFYTDREDKKAEILDDVVETKGNIVGYESQ